MHMQAIQQVMHSTLHKLHADLQSDKDKKITLSTLLLDLL